MFIKLKALKTRLLSPRIFLLCLSSNPYNLRLAMKKVNDISATPRLFWHLEQILLPLILLFVICEISPRIPSFHPIHLIIATFSTLQFQYSIFRIIFLINLHFNQLLSSNYTDPLSCSVLVFLFLMLSNMGRSFKLEHTFIYNFSSSKHQSYFPLILEPKFFS